MTGGNGGSYFSKQLRLCVEQCELLYGALHENTCFTSTTGMVDTEVVVGCRVWHLHVVRVPLRDVSDSVGRCLIRQNQKGWYCRVGTAGIDVKVGTAGIGVKVGTAGIDTACIELKVGTVGIELEVGTTGIELEVWYYCYRA